VEVNGFVAAVVVVVVMVVVAGVGALV